MRPEKLRRGVIKMASLHPGVTYWEDDRGKGPFKIRVGGTHSFVSLVDPTYKYNYPPGRVITCEGWDNDTALLFDSMDEALTTADLVWDIEGLHTSIEVSREWI